MNGRGIVLTIQKAPEFWCELLKLHVSESREHIACGQRLTFGRQCKVVRATHGVKGGGEVGERSRFPAVSKHTCTMPCSRG